MASFAPGFDFSQAFPNVQYVGAGYDLLFTDPTAYGDSTSQRISAFVLAPSGFFPDGQHMIPQGMVYLPGSSEFDDSDGTMVWSTSSLQQKFRVTVEGEVGVEDAASFTTSTFYQRVTNDLSSQQNFHYVQCHVKQLYTLAMQMLPGANFWPQFLSPAFQATVANLGTEESYLQLIANFGTHFAKSVSYGGNYFIDLTISASSWEHSSQDDVGFKAGVEGVVEGIKLGGSVGFETGQSSANAQGIGLMQQQLRAGGGNAVDASFQDWQQNWQTNMIPVSVVFAPYTALLTAEYFPSDPAIDLKRMQLAQILMSYLQSHQLAAAAVPRFNVRAFQIVRLDGGPDNDLEGTSWNLTIRGLNRNGVPQNQFPLNGQCGLMQRTQALDANFKMAGDYASLTVEGIITDPTPRGGTVISDPTPAGQQFDLGSLQPGGSGVFQVMFWENLGNFHTRVDFEITRVG